MTISSVEQLLQSELGQLTNVDTLNFQGTNRGTQEPHPDYCKLAPLTKLEELSFQINLITGTIPNELGRLTMLDRLR